MIQYESNNDSSWHQLRKMEHRRLIKGIKQHQNIRNEPFPKQQHSLVLWLCVWCLDYLTFNNAWLKLLVPLDIL